MIEFLRPTTKVYVGTYFEIPAVICTVSIGVSMEPLYSVQWFDGADIHEAWLNRFQFSLEAGTPPPGYETIELKEPTDSEIPGA